MTRLLSLYRRWVSDDIVVAPLSPPRLLRREPGVAEALGSRSSFLGNQIQHGEEEAAEALRVLPLPLVLLHQDVQKPPRLQLSDVPQLTCVTHANITFINMWIRELHPNAYPLFYTTTYCTLYILDIPVCSGCCGDMNDFLKWNKCLNLFPIYHIVHTLQSSHWEVTLPG